VVVELPYYLLPPLAETLNRILAYPWRDDAPVLRNRIGSKWHDREAPPLVRQSQGRGRVRRARPALPRFAWDADHLAA
jgi:hypothetical protein